MTLSSQPIVLVCIFHIYANKSATIIYLSCYGFVAGTVGVDLQGLR